MFGASPFIGFIPVRDLDSAQAFYVTTLGLVVNEETPAGLVLDAAGTMLRITVVGEFSPQPFTIAGWQALDITETVGQLTDGGVEMLRYGDVEQDDDGIWTAPNGDRVAWFGDPDGNVLSLTQFAGTVLDDFWV